MEMPREAIHFSSYMEYFERLVGATLAVAALTALMFLIGRDQLGEGVIALLYLIPISWSTARWGQGAGIVAAVAAALAFNFFFIPPFYTLYIGSLEGWLLLGIFLAVAIVVVGRIQSGLTQAQARERDAVFMYELSAALAGALTPESVAQILAEKTQQLFQAAVVQVFVDWDGRSFTVSQPVQESLQGKPAFVLPIMAARRFAGEIRLWQGETRLPSPENRLLLNFTNQGALALERARLAQIHVRTEREVVK